MSEIYRLEAPELSAEERARVEAFGIHPELEETRGPSIPNPLMENPWAQMTDEEIAHEIFAASTRIDAAEHMKRSLQRELIRRHPYEEEGAER